jgi:hypothetical protein
MTTYHTITQYYTIFSATDIVPNSNDDTQNDKNKFNMSHVRALYHTK